MHYANNLQDSFLEKLVTAISKHQTDLTISAAHQQCYVDTPMMYLSRMVVACYGGDSSNLPMSDLRQVVECIKVGLVWHKLINIGQRRPLSIDIDRQLEVLENNNQYISNNITKGCGCYIRRSSTGDSDESHGRDGTYIFLESCCESFK